VHFSASSFIQAPLSALLEYSGILRAEPGPHHPGAAAGAPGEVSIRIVGAGEAAGGASSSGSEGVVEEGDVDAAAARGAAHPSAPVAPAAGAESSSSYQRYDIQQVARWVEQILPFSLLLLVVFIRQHLQGPPRSPTFISFHDPRVQMFVFGPHMIAFGPLQKQYSLRLEI
jgi:hypothetical protein